MHPLIRLIVVLGSAVLLYIASGYSRIRMDNNVPDVDIVLSYYREDLALVSRQISHLRALLHARHFSSRVTVYIKDESLPSNRTEFLQNEMGADKVLRLHNKGREGGTFLTHIVTHYDECRASRRCARHVLFAQSLMEDDALVASRISVLKPTTAFLSLGPYRKCDCGRDPHKQRKVFPRMREIYSMFTGRLCPAGGQLCSYWGQFIVSQHQIFSNPREKYQHILDTLEAPMDHWIYDDPEDATWEYAGQKSGPSSPFFGHALERSWPVIFGCLDASISDRCTPTNPESCQCPHRK